ncbi:MAG: hypothetical protein CW338_06635 [Clostridiales bacterium]|nr:hypothetical protein [Clostridiales bacterium]
MSGKMMRTRAAVFFFVLLFAAQACLISAAADDAELLKELPGEWTFSVAIDDETFDMAYLILEEDGGLILNCNGEDGEFAYSCRGTWSLELITEYSSEYGLRDRLTLLYTSTDDPQYEGTAFSAESVYYVYSESWMENDTRCTCLITEKVSGSGEDPLEALCSEENETILIRTEGPNMQVVNCSSFVSLRETPSTKAARLAKVPLNALVFAFTDEAEENGFIRCVYHDEYGYILAEYLQPAGE